MLNESIRGNTVHILSEEHVFSVSELSISIKSMIEESFGLLSVQGEISGLKIHTSGHTYLSLKDKDSVINAICWRGTKLAFPLEEGMEIVARGRVTTYQARSSYQFIIEGANIAGEGALLKLLNERRKKFEQMGYFDKKNPVPKYPETIGIVTSKTGAVLQDMLHRLKDRYQFCTVVIWPVNVQGAGAADQIASAVRGFNFMTEKNPDVLIVARGGGSIEDLFPFNEEVVVKAVYDSKIPVISAIGHETDITLIDYAADLRAPTPTAAIEFATPVLFEVKNQIIENVERSKNAMRRILREHITIVSAFSKAMLISKLSIIAVSQKFDDITDKFLKIMRTYIEREVLKLQQQKMMNLTSYIDYKRHIYTSKLTVFDNIMKKYFAGQWEIIRIFASRLEQSSYRKILEKGFCFVLDKNNNAIKTKLEFEKTNKNNLLLQFYDGTVDL
ncbi:MAG: exodeoxyribonuclease VII large subunit [Holosporales bacterium]|nr:exodeoxyribonuclease VII large subunit [Holosporales bacterium]